MSTTLPLTVAVSVVTFLDPVEMRQLFMSCRRWQQIGASDGVAQHLCSSVYNINTTQTAAALSLRSMKRVNEPESVPASSSSSDDDSAAPPAMARSSEKEKEHLTPAQILSSDPEFGGSGTNPSLAASLARNLMMLSRFCHDHEVGYLDSDRQVIRTIMMMMRNNSNKDDDREEDGGSSNSSSRLYNHFARPLSANQFKKLFDSNPQYGTIWENASPQVRLLYRLTNGTCSGIMSDGGSEEGEQGTENNNANDEATRDSENSSAATAQQQQQQPQGRSPPRRQQQQQRRRRKHPIFSPFGSVQSYEVVDGFMIHPLEEMLEVAAGRFPPGLRNQCFPIGSYGSNLVVVVNRRGVTELEASATEATTSSSTLAGSQQQQQRQQQRSVFNSMLSTIKEESVHLLRGMSVMPLASSIHSLFKWWVDKLINKKHYGTQQLVLQDPELSLLAGDGGGQEEEEEEEEESGDSTRRGTSRSRSRRSQQQQVSIISFFPRCVASTTTTTINSDRSSLLFRTTSSHARTRTPAGDIIVEMSVALLPTRCSAQPNGRSVYFFAYRCRIWRELTTTSASITTVTDGGNEDEEAEQQQRQRNILPRLRTRRWRIFWSEQSREAQLPADTVQGAGVVGMHPCLLPIRDDLRNSSELRERNAVVTDDEPIDGVFQYESGTTMPAAHGGSMEGEFYFDMIRDVQGFRPRDDELLPPEDDADEDGGVWVKVRNFPCEFNTTTVERGRSSSSSIATATETSASTLSEDSDRNGTEAETVVSYIYA